MVPAASRFRLAEFAALLADPARAGMLLALIDGRWRPAGELAAIARVSAATASAHLRRLVEGGLLVVQAQGRHRYYGLAGEEAADLVESFVLAGTAPPRAATHSDTAMARARTCYRHLAGRVGVALFDRLREHDGLRLDAAAVRVTPQGADWLARVGLAQDTRVFATERGRACLDWTERRFHLGGALGSRLATALLDAGWLRRRAGTRALALGAHGAEGLRVLGVAWP